MVEDNFFPSSKGENCQMPRKWVKIIPSDDSQCRFHGVTCACVSLVPNLIPISIFSVEERGERKIRKVSCVRLIITVIFPSNIKISSLFHCFSPCSCLLYFSTRLLSLAAAAAVLLFHAPFTMNSCESSPKFLNLLFLFSFAFTAVLLSFF